MKALTLDSVAGRPGASGALPAAMMQLAHARGHAVPRTLVSNNMVVDALRGYQTRGFRVIAACPGSINASRKSKPAVPLTGACGLPCRDVIELELAL